MKKRILSFILVISILSSIILPVHAVENEEFLYGKVIATGYDSFGDLGLRIVDAQGNYNTYMCNNETLINGKPYYNTEDLEAAIPVGSFVNFAVENKEVIGVSIDFDAEKYDNLTYNIATKTFNSLDSSTASLPIYYSYSDHPFVPAYLDENHIYSIELYDYAINIKKMSALNKPETIESIVIEDDLNSEFLKDISIYCDTTSEDSVLRAQLYDNNSNLLYEDSVYCDLSSDVYFNNLSNITTTYKIKLWLEDKNDNAISHIYEKEYQTNENSILYGKVEKTGYGSFGDLGLRIVDAQGNYNTYMCNNETLINGKPYYNTEDLEAAIPVGSFVNFAVDDGYIAVVNTVSGDLPGTEYIPNQNVNIKTNQDPAYMPSDINMVTINGRGTAYGRFKILNQDGTPAKKKVVNYSVDGGAKTSVTTDNYGYAMVKIADITKSKNYNITFSGKDISTTTGILIVTVEALHFKSGTESSIQKGVSVGAGLEVGGEFGKLEAKAGVASVGAEGSETNSLSFEQEYANNKHKITLSSKTNYSAAAQAKLGLFAGVELPNVAGIDGELMSVNGKAGYGRFVGVSYEDDDFKYTDSQDILDLSKFMLSAFIGTQQGNVATKYIAQILDTPINAYEKGSVINLESGASAGTIEMKKGDVKGGVTLSGVNAKSVWTNSTKTKADKSHVYSTEIAAGGGTKLFDTSIGYSKAKTSLGSMSDFINDNLKFSATEDKDGNLKEISLSSKQSGEDGSFLYKKTETTAKKITYKDEAAEKVANADNELKKFVNGDKAYFSKAQMNQAIDKVINSDQSGIYSQTQNTKEALSLDLSASFKLLVKLGGKYGLSGSSFYEYESENGIYENGTAYIQAENDIKDAVEGLTISFDEIKEYTKDTINNILSSIWETVEGLVDQTVEYGQAVIENAKDTVTGWVVSITKAVNPIHSVAILAIEDEISLFPTASLATTIGEPYIIAVEDEEGNEITDFSENPLTLNLSYTEEQLYEAGVTDIDSISVVRWDDEKCVYVKQEGVHDKENACITLDILKPGQYILAVDNCAPAITQFGVNGKGQSPEFYAVVSDMSGIQEFTFSIDDEEMLNDYNLEEYYNYTTGEFSYKTTGLTEGEHIATIYAKDTFGNEIEESISFTIDNSTPEISNITTLPQVITENMTISANVSNASESSVMLNTEVTDIYGNTVITTVDMVEINGQYIAELPEIENGFSINVWVSAYSEAGNGSESEKQQAIVMKSNDNTPVFAITRIDGSSVGVKCSDIDDYEDRIAYLGVYNEEGKLLQLKSMNLAEDISFTNVTEKGYIKVFAWDENLSPIGLPIEAEKR